MKSLSTSKVAVIGGCGHVGLPLGISIAEWTSHQVVLIDVNQSSVDKVNRGEISFVENGGEEALRGVVGKSLRATTDAAEVAGAEYVIFVTGTPVDEHLNPRTNDLIAVLDQYRPFLKSGQTLILRSTIFPGSTELVRNYLESHNLKVFLSYCPERVAQGHALAEIANLPQIVSAFDRESEERSVKLFESVAASIIRLTPAEAELTKLFANGWRYLQFAIANQFYMMAESNGIDFHRVYQALTLDYPRAKDFARPGFSAGPCLFKDTMQIAAFHDNQFFLGHSAMLVNEGLPNFVVQQLGKKLGNLQGKKIAVLGMAFKANNDDTRESLSYKVKKILAAKMAVVLETDVYQASHAKLNEVIEAADAIILGVPHREYLDLDLRGKTVIDCWGALGEKPNVVKSPFSRENQSNAAVRGPLEAFGHSMDSGSAA